MDTDEDHDWRNEDPTTLGENPGSIRDSAGELLSQVSDACEGLSTGELYMDISTNDGKTHSVSPKEIELTAEGEAGFIATHKEGFFIGGVTVAGVLAGVATIALIRRNKHG